MREDGETKSLPKKSLIRCPSRLPNPVIVSKDNPRIAGWPPAADSLKEVEEPIDGAPHLVATHQGVREGLLTAAA